MVEINQAQITKANFLSQILGAQWFELPEVLKKRYTLMSLESHQAYKLLGHVEEHGYSWWAKFLIPLISLFSVAIPNKSQLINLDIQEFPVSLQKVHRIRYVFPNKTNEPCHQLKISSILNYCNMHEFIEYSRFGLGLALHVAVEDNILIYRDMGFVFKFFGKPINILPLGLLIGRVIIKEYALDHESFSRKVIVAHPWFGVFLKFKATFKLCTK